MKPCKKASIRRTRIVSDASVSMLLKHLRQLIRKNRRAMPLRVTANVSEKFLRAWYNEAFFEFKDNGESFVARIFGQWIGNKPTTIWDVGANTGQWALEVKSIIPTAKIHCFEIIPTILSQLKSNVSIHKHNLYMTLVFQTHKIL